MENVIEKVKGRILYRLKNIPKANLGSEYRLYAEFPSERFPQNVKKLRIELFAFRLAFCDGRLTKEQQNTAALLGLEKRTCRISFMYPNPSSNLTTFEPVDDSICIRCPKLLKDTDARLGVIKAPMNPDRKEKIFGYNCVPSASVELHIGLELSVDISNITGNVKKQVIFLKIRSRSMSTMNLM